MSDNLILRTDAYKVTHPAMLPERGLLEDYLEARTGAGPDPIVWVGLQPILKKYLEGPVITREMIDEAESVLQPCFGEPLFKRAGWDYIVDVHGGRLPLRIKALDEGMVVPRGTALMTYGNTDPNLPWLPGWFEGLLEKVWYPMTVATRSFHVRMMLERAVLDSGATPLRPAGARHMLHDFGYRGVGSEETADIGAGAHLFVGSGSDTLSTILWLRRNYGASNPLFSVAATEHRVMTLDGPEVEHEIARRVAWQHPNQIVSLVADSYDYYKFVDAVIRMFEDISRRRTQLVIRPDSPTPDHKTPESLVLWTLQRIHEGLPHHRIEKTDNGRILLPISVLWGDGIDEDGIARIVKLAMDHNYAAQNLVFGMGGGLLQKLNRDTLRVATKCSWWHDGTNGHDVYKRPLDVSKASKRGQLAVVHRGDSIVTTSPRDIIEGQNLLHPVYDYGMLLRQHTYSDVSGRIEKAMATMAAPRCLIA